MAAPPPEKAPASAQLYVRWALVNLFLTAAAAGLTLWIWSTEQGVRGHLAKVRQQAQTCAAAPPAAKPAPPPAEPPPAPPPPQDAPRSGYIGAKGTAIDAVMRLSVEALRAGRPDDAPLESLRIGSQDVLPSGAIHIVNLWATWCDPCKEEMPDFKKMFERHAEAWGDTVRFLPILTRDPVEPRQAYNRFSKDFPPAPVKLSDRSYEELLVHALTPGGDDALFKDSLPVTLVLDCNRRVRWASFTQLGEAEFADLEAHLEKFRAELADTSEDAWCREKWAGNGRCEPGEDTAAGHSPEDCGELRRRPGADDPPGTAEPTPPVLEPCAANMQRAADGRCVPKLKGTQTPTKAATPPPTSKRCGDGKCEPARGESHRTCCQDCACEAPLVCKPDSDANYRCQVKGLK